MGNDEAMRMICECEDKHFKLTQWEHGFIKVISKRIDRQDLTHPQLMKLQSIWKRVTET